MYFNLVFEGMKVFGFDNYEVYLLFMWKEFMKKIIGYFNLKYFKIKVDILLWYLKYYIL